MFHNSFSVITQFNAYTNSDKFGLKRNFLIIEHVCATDLLNFMQLIKSRDEKR